MGENIRMTYRKDLDEVCVYNCKTHESIVYIQGYSSKYQIPVSREPSMEQLIQLSVSYPEVRAAL